MQPGRGCTGQGWLFAGIIGLFKAWKKGKAVKILNKSQDAFAARLTDYLTGELPEADRQDLENRLLRLDSGLNKAQRDLVNGLREDERRLQFDNQLLEGYKSDAPDPATLRTMVGRWQQAKSARRASNLARLGLGFGAGLACILLLVSLLFSLDNLQTPPTDQNGAVVGSAVPTRAPDSSALMVFPVKGKYIILAYFGEKTDEGISNGLYIAAVGGTPIIAVDEGVVVSAGWLDDQVGNAIVISHPNGLSTRYHHLASVHVKAGEQVIRGQEIGIIGTTGASVGIHLTFQVLKNGAYINPMLYLPE
jgi:murein DD-endopeptidase MepM/ murein hydrolase activator NlpD